MDIKVEMECVGSMISSVEGGEHVITFRPVMGQAQNLVAPHSPFGEIQLKTRSTEEAQAFQLRGRYALALSTERIVEAA